MDLMTWVRQEHDANRARFRDWFVAAVPADRWTARPHGGPSFAWLALHTAVHHDLAVHAAALGTGPVAAAHWDGLGTGLDGPWTALVEVDGLGGATPDVGSIVAYVDAVGDATAAWLERATAADLDAVPPSADRLAAAGVVDPSVAWVAERWAGRPVSWLVQWEALGHTLLHHGEMAALRGPLGAR